MGEQDPAVILLFQAALIHATLIHHRCFPTGL